MRGFLPLDFQGFSGTALKPQLLLAGRDLLFNCYRIYDRES